MVLDIAFITTRNDSTIITADGWFPSLYTMSPRHACDEQGNMTRWKYLYWDYQTLYCLIRC